MLLQRCDISDEIFAISEEEFGKEPVYLSLSGMFSEKGLRYTYQEYLQHLETTKQFAEEHAGSSFVADVKNKLKNGEKHGEYAFVVWAK